MLLYIVTGLFLFNDNTIGPTVGLLSLVLREASEGRSGQEIIVEGQIGTKNRRSTKCILRMSVSQIVTWQGRFHMTNSY